jgi:hypothetical protein
LSAALAGCVETGDFGRPRPAIVGEDLLPFTGSIAASIGGFAYTDDERELRNRAWRFLAPAQELSWFERQLAELTRTARPPPSARFADLAAYHRALVGVPARSPASRYRRVSNDMHADTELIGPFVETAARVAAADEVRLRSLLFVQHLSEPQARAAAARVAENRCLVAWVAVGIAERTAAYRYALEHLVIETPQGEAIPAERSLARLEANLAALHDAPVSLSATACGGLVAAAPRGTRTVISK